MTIQHLHPSYESYVRYTAVESSRGVLVAQTNTTTALGNRVLTSGIRNWHMQALTSPHSLVRSARSVVYRAAEFYDDLTYPFTKAAEKLVFTAAKCLDFVEAGDVAWNIRTIVREAFNVVRKTWNRAIRTIIDKLP